MNKRTYLMALPLLLLAVGVIGCIRNVAGDSDAVVEQGASHVNVDPRVEEALEVDESVKVLISLRDLDELAAVPIDEWTKELLLGIDWDLRARHAQEVQANVRSVLGPEDATRVVGFQTIPALGATITASGLEKLRNHPDVVAIASALGGEWAEQRFTNE